MHIKASHKCRLQKPCLSFLSHASPCLLLPSPLSYHALHGLAEWKAEPDLLSYMSPLPSEEEGAAATELDKSVQRQGNGSCPSSLTRGDVCSILYIRE